MRQRAVIRVLATALALGGGCTADRAVMRPTDPKKGTGFVTIFDGTSLDGWEIYIEPPREARPDAFFLENSTLACKGYGYHWFRYREPLGDCVVRLEFRCAKDTNSGVCLRSRKDGAPPFTGFEVQILDDIGKDPHKHSTGAIYDVVTPMYNASRPLGEWNELEITCKGPLVQVVVNGLKVIDTDFSRLTSPIGKFDFPYSALPRTGYLALQDHWTPIWYRNIRLKRL